MFAYHITTAVLKDKKLELTDLPFHEGEQVDVVVLKHAQPAGTDEYPLRGKPIQYKAPFEPVAEQDWEPLN